MKLPSTPEPPDQHDVDEPPPFLGTWRHVYTFVLCYLVATIVAFYLFSRTYTP